MKWILCIAIFLSFVTRPSVVFAATPPAFPACINPQGEVIASYPSGSFGIVGKVGSFAGKDTVYRIGDGALTQCFCPVDGNGIQTNWWKVSNLTTEEINEQVAQGWVLVPDGSAWGLEAVPYLALNIDYSCSTGSVQGTSSLNNSGVGGQILGLAATGNIESIMILAIFGTLLVTSGVLIRRK